MKNNKLILVLLIIASGKMLSLSTKIKHPKQPKKLAKLAEDNQEIVSLPESAILTLRKELNKNNLYKECDTVNTESGNINLSSKCPSNTLPTQYPNGLIRARNDLSSSEKNILNGSYSKRKADTQTAIIKSGWLSDANNPGNLRIAFCASGGGTRAALATLGFMQGAEKIGLLQMTTYMSSLSGSTWTLSAWLSSVKSLQAIENEWKKTLTNNTTQKLKSVPLTENSIALNNLAEVLVEKTIFEQPIGPVDIWGGLIAQCFLGNLIKNPVTARMTPSQISNILPQGTNANSYPFPIYSAVAQDNGKEFNWYEITPIECGSTDIGFWCPTWAFGRKLDNGVSKKWKTESAQDEGSEYGPEQTLGYFMGICASAFDINISDIIKDLRPNINNAIKRKSNDFKKVANAALDYIVKSNKGAKPIHPAKVNNYTLNMEDSSIKNKNYIELRDASLKFNIPLPPLLRKERAIDIIFIFDSSDKKLSDQSVQQSINSWALKHGIRLPDFAKYQNKLDQKSIIRMDGGDYAPMLVYMPLIKDKHISYSKAAANFDLEKCMKSSCNKLNFNYTSDEFDGLISLAYQNITQNESSIKEALKIAAENLSKQEQAWYTYE